MQVRLGCRVVSSDGKQIGKVDRIVLDPDDHTLREFIVHRGMLLSPDRIVDPALVARVDDDCTVHLRATAEEADTLPTFFEHEYIVPSAQEVDALPFPLGGGATGIGASMSPILWGTSYTGTRYNPASRSLFQVAAVHPAAVERRSNLPADTVLIDKGTDVVDPDGKKLGSVEEVEYDEHGETIALRVRTGHIHHHEIRVPIAWVAGIAHDHIRLRAMADEADEIGTLDPT